MTLRQLLQHTSGLPDYTTDPGFVEILRADPRHVFDPRTLLDFVADEPLLFVPGSLYEYSNSDNIAVALMAEAVTDRRYEDLLKELVYRPLGLRRTSLPLGYRLRSRTCTATTSSRRPNRRTSARHWAPPASGPPVASSPPPGNWAPSSAPTAAPPCCRRRPARSS